VFFSQPGNDGLDLFPFVASIQIDRPANPSPDFGTGYSSLAYLQQLPVDCLKIDRSFTSAITASSESKGLIGTFVQLGKDLGLMTLAEGVETTEQLDLLRNEHIDQVQGFLLARPLDPRGLETQILEPARPITDSNFAK
jgi:EAL domain-containing protein (putative c-di-GMP-specific phosphodiesterase class I)